MTRKLILPAAAVAILFLAACGSSGGLGDLGDIFGGGGSSSASDQIRGTVDYVDTSQQIVVLKDVSEYSTRLQDGTSAQVRVYYDDRTTVTWQGNTYRPSDLESGDQVAVRITRSNDRLHAESMEVLHNAGGTGTGTGSAASTVSGTVQYVDTSRRTIEVDRAGYGGVTTVAYDANTAVDYQGRTYRPAELERGDEIEIRTRSVSGGQLVAERIAVIRPGGSTTGTANRTIRGTVQYVDASRRTLELSQTSWISRFSTGGTGTAGTTDLTWDDTTRVEYQGQLYPPTSLERGDVVDVSVTQTGSTYRADRILVVRDVNVR
ncbi:MAG: DUF5666 domain-containing protein [Thermoanaerobaculia bacterium]